jgi:protein transport protein SEC61 subunit gamma-like protein
MASSDSTSKSFEDRVQSRQDQFETWVRSFGRGSWARIIRMARKPTKMEFRQTIWVCGIGMFVLGFIGFVMLWLMDTELPKFFQWLIG